MRIRQLIVCFLIVIGLFTPALAPKAGLLELSGDWPTYNGPYSGDRYSPLTWINKSNVNTLKQVASFDTGEQGSFQNGPLVISGIMYVTTDVYTFAIDAATCELKWKHVHDYSPRSYLGNSRGVGYLSGRIFRGSGDGHVYAINAKTGKSVWDVPIADPAIGETIPAAPIAWEKMVFIGNAGGDVFGVTGRVYALSAEDGHVIWRFDTVPATGPARATWPLASDANPPTGGATWTSYSLDAKNGILYVSTGNAAPDFALALRPGESLYTTCVVALDARTGKILSYVQPIKQDEHDYDVAAAPALILTRGNQLLAIAAAKDGLLYGIDRSGVKVEDGVDANVSLAPGTMPIKYRAQTTTRLNLDKRLSPDYAVNFRPGTQGGNEWNGPAFSPKLNMVFVSAADWGTTLTLAPADTLKGAPGQAWTGASDPKAPFGAMDPVSEWAGWLTAFDADTGNEVWKYKSPMPLLAAVTPTASGLLFTGDLAGNILAFNSATGELLWQHNIGQPMGAGIITYRVGRIQYLAVAAGKPSGIWPVDANGTSHIYVFALPQPAA
jgi:alcohol dehydrogenase (cytochrome c)